MLLLKFYKKSKKIKMSLKLFKKLLLFKINDKMRFGEKSKTRD